MNSYELVYVVDPRLSDEETATLSDEAKQLLESLDAKVVKEESWGKRRLAYPIQKLTEGRYILYRIETEDGNNPFPEVERRLQQNDNVLRYLTVALDKGRLRERGAPPSEEEAAAAETTTEEESD